MIFKRFIFLLFVVKLIDGIENHEAITIATLSILNSSYVHMYNESVVFEKINKIVSEGPDKLQVITDFDRTITKPHVNNTLEMDSFDIFFECKQLPEANFNRISIKRSNYDAIQFNTSILFEQAKQVAEDLYLTYQTDLQDFLFDKKEIEQVVQKYGPEFRDRADELFSKLNNSNIPLTIFSAGLGDVIRVQLTEKTLEYENVYLIANFLKYDGMTLKGFENSESMINAYNKPDRLQQNINPKVLENRKNVIVMGDHIGDASMVKNIEDEITSLKIGFLYGETEEKLQIYKEKFDIVLIDDQTMNVILDIINLL